MLGAITAIGLLYLLNLKWPSDTIYSLTEAWLWIILPGYLLYCFPGIFALLHPFKRAMNLLFARIGEGSYTIYLLHYPLVQLLATHLKLAIWLQILLLAMACFLAIRLESWVNHYPFGWFKRRYV